eukprot:1160048-Pelagomonas_calceolata.AAC.10
MLEIFPFIIICKYEWEADEKQAGDRRVALKDMFLPQEMLKLSCGVGSHCSNSSAGSCWPWPGLPACMRQQGQQAAAEESSKPLVKD